MANLKILIKQDAWTQGLMGTITTSLVQIMTTHGLSADQINWNGPTELLFNISKIGMTYAEMKAFRTEIEAGVEAAAAVVKIFEWNDL